MCAMALGSKEQSSEEKLEQAVIYKQQGNEHYKNQNFRAATGKYHRALLYIKGIDSAANSPFQQYVKEPEILSEETKAKVVKVKVDCYNNLAACLLQAAEPKYRKILDYCNEVLENDDNNLKALYRKGVSLYHLKDTDKAMEVLNIAKQLPGGEKDTKIKQQLILCERQLVKDEQKLKQTYKGMFEKMAGGEPETLTNNTGDITDM